MPQEPGGVMSPQHRGAVSKAAAGGIPGVHRLHLPDGPQLGSSSLLPWAALDLDLAHPGLCPAAVGAGSWDHAGVIGELGWQAARSGWSSCVLSLKSIGLSLESLCQLRDPGEGQAEARLKDAHEFTFAPSSSQLSSPRACGLPGPGLRTELCKPPTWTCERRPQRGVAAAFREGAWLVGELSHTLVIGRNTQATKHR